MSLWWWCLWPCRGYKRSSAHPLPQYHQTGTTIDHDHLCGRLLLSWRAFSSTSRSHFGEGHAIKTKVTLAVTPQNSRCVPLLPQQQIRVRMIPEKKWQAPAETEICVRCANNKYLSSPCVYSHAGTDRRLQAHIKAQNVKETSVYIIPQSHRTTRASKTRNKKKKHIWHKNIRENNNHLCLCAVSFVKAALAWQWHRECRFPLHLQVAFFCHRRPKCKHPRSPLEGRRKWAALGTAPRAWPH